MKRLTGNGNGGKELNQKSDRYLPLDKQAGPTLYNGKPVWTEDTFDYGEVQPGDYVEQAVVDDAMDCLPPACMRSDCSQMGEPYRHRLDPKTGKWRATYATFKRVAGQWPDSIWEYCGHCFCGENTERGEDPVCCVAEEAEI